MKQIVLLLSSKPYLGFLLFSKAKPKSLLCSTGLLGSSQLSKELMWSNSHVDQPILFFTTEPHRSSCCSSVHWHPALRTSCTLLPLPGILAGSRVTHSKKCRLPSSHATGKCNGCHLCTSVAYLSLFFLNGQYHSLTCPIHYLFLSLISCMCPSN